MAIRFPNLEFPGTHGSPIPEPTDLRATRSTFAGLNGEVELILGRGGRSISIPIVIHGTGLTTAAKVAALLSTYDRGVGYHGDLEISGAVARSFPDCTFLGFMQQESILPDVGKTLNAGASADSDYYFVRGTLNFRQLSVEGG